MRGKLLLQRAYRIMGFFGSMMGFNGSLRDLYGFNGLFPIKVYRIFQSNLPLA